jgi:RNA-splicing ligase RtcB
VIVPNAVGVDIGCGMCAVRTSLTDIDKETLNKILAEIILNDDPFSKDFEYKNILLSTEL